MKNIMNNELWLNDKDEYYKEDDDFLRHQQTMRNREIYEEQEKERQKEVEEVEKKNNLWKEYQKTDKVPFIYKLNWFRDNRIDDVSKATITYIDRMYFEKVYLVNLKKNEPSDFKYSELSSDLSQKLLDILFFMKINNLDSIIIRYKYIGLNETNELQRSIISKMLLGRDENYIPYENYNEKYFIWFYKQVLVSKQLRPSSPYGCESSLKIDKNQLYLNYSENLITAVQKNAEISLV